MGVIVGLWKRVAVKAFQESVNGGAFAGLICQFFRSVGAWFLAGFKDGIGFRRHLFSVLFAGLSCELTINRALHGLVYDRPRSKYAAPV
jgi:hypothetical protein